jgi:hypothetical protein
LNDIRRNARASGVAEQARDLAGEDREQRRRQADKKTCAYARRTAPQIALDADDRAQRARDRQP